MTALGIRNPRDFWAGVVFVVIGAGFAITALDYDVGTASRMGPAYFPLVLAIVLVLLGALVLIPALTHRLLGVLALLVALATAAAVLSLLAGAGWTTARFDVGVWAGVAVAGFGLAGALKAMLTLPLVAAVDDAGEVRGPESG